MRRRPLSLRLRLLLQLLGIAALLAVVLYFTVRTVANQAVEATQDGILGAAALSIAEGLQGGETALHVNLSYEAFSILGSISGDRVFYRIDADESPLTGYADLPLPERLGTGVTPVFYTSAYLDTTLRLAAVARTIIVARKPVHAVVVLGQTRQSQTAIAGTIARRAAALGLGFFALAALLSRLSASSVLRPVNRLAEAVGRRGPQDLRPLSLHTAEELRPFVTALNGFIARLRGALSRTETFIAEAAHHIRTPLATVRARAEIALRKSQSEEMREMLRAVIRAVEESSRSAGQLLDHATVIYRSDHMAEERVDLAALATAQIRAFQPTAELRDVTLDLHHGGGAVEVRGDRALIENALRNLIDNAIKYSRPDTTIDITLSTGAMAGIEVADRGRGLSGQDHTRLSRRFERGDNVADIIGSGLGLTIVQEVAAAHAGRFELVEREGGGTCARLFLPLG